MIVSGDESYKHEKENAMMEAVPQSKYESLPSPRILNNHLYPKHMPTDFFKRERKIIFIVRNPKDVAVSFYNHTFNLDKCYFYHGDFKNYLKLFIQGESTYIVHTIVILMMRVCYPKRSYNPLSYFLSDLLRMLALPVCRNWPNCRDSRFYLKTPC